MNVLGLFYGMNLEKYHNVGLHEQNIPSHSNSKLQALIQPKFELTLLHDAHEQEVQESCPSQAAGHKNPRCKYLCPTNISLILLCK